MTGSELVVSLHEPIEVMEFPSEKKAVKTILGVSEMVFDNAKNLSGMLCHTSERFDGEAIRRAALVCPAAPQEKLGAEPFTVEEGISVTKLLRAPVLNSHTALY